MTHILLAISAHGYGHLSQVAPVANELARICPDLRLTVRTSLPKELVHSRIRTRFEYWERADDFGLVQHSVFEVDRHASADAYREFHGNWPARVEAVAAQLAALGPDLLLADVPYLTLAGAARAGIPAVALCSLNWADIYAHYFGRDEIHGQILHAYRGAELFLRPQPAMPMEDISTRAVGPVVEPGRCRRAELNTLLNLRDDERLVLVSLGGMRSRLPIESWPRLPGVRWVVPARWRILRPDVVAMEQIAMPFSDILASMDLLVTKPGYGSFTEAAAAGVPVAYIPRSDWPEEPWLVTWLEQHGRAKALPYEAAQSGDVAGIFFPLLEMGRYRPIVPSGIGEAAREVLAAAGAAPAVTL